MDPHLSHFSKSLCAYLFWFKDCDRTVASVPFLYLGFFPMAYVQLILTLALSTWYKDTSNETGPGPENLIQKQREFRSKKTHF